MKLLSFQDMGSHLEKVVLALGFFFFFSTIPSFKKSGTIPANFSKKENVTSDL